MRGVTGSLQGVSNEGEGDGRPSRGAGVWKEEQRISLKVQRGLRRTSIPFLVPEDRKDMRENPASS